MIVANFLNVSLTRSLSRISHCILFFKIYQLSGDERYCHKTLYKFAFGSLLLPYVLAGVAMLVLLALVCVAIFSGDSSDDDGNGDASIL